LGGEVCVRGLSQNSLQADKAILEILTGFGAHVFAEPDRVRVEPAPLRGTVIDVSQCPDLFPLCAVLAAAADGESRLINAGRLRLKESDRIEAVKQMLCALGVEVREEETALTIQGGIIKGGVVDSAGDHRIAMAAAIASICAPDSVIIQGAECCKKSYPKFFEDFHMLGGKTHVV
jgi:3-phosphoshikimate 1-carboxyvinyltransferase